MAGAFHGVGEAESVVSVGVSGPGVVHHALQFCKGETFDVVAETIKKTAFQITRMGQMVAAEAAKRGGCDILVTCAGGNEARCCASRVPFYEQPVEVLDWGIDVNLKGPIYFARACMPQMVAKE